MNTVSVSMSQLAVANGLTVLEAPGLGSCVALCLYDRKKKIGGLAHIMLPEENSTGPLPHINIFDQQTQKDVQSGKYATTAVSALVHQLQKNGSQSADLEAKIAGGAEMFPGFKTSKQSLGEKNVQKVKEMLLALHIPLISEDTGGNSGRSVRFSVTNGDVEIRKRI